MGTKVTSSSGSVLEEPEIQKLQMQAKIFKENSLNKLNALKSTTQLLDRQSILYQQAFAQLPLVIVSETFKFFSLFNTMNSLETLLNAETLPQMDYQIRSNCNVKRFHHLLQFRDKHAWIVSDEELKRRNWKHIRYHGKDSGSLYLQKSVLLIRIGTVTKQDEKMCFAHERQPILRTCCKITNLDETVGALGKATKHTGYCLIALQTTD
ncbi:hypothetical protein Tco_1043987 [Tanacetum coccineum]|uniref:Uncharacterized protein n=1 Tax=Tanacetum coccineum TaxID=301880 RepID=A0ABQ5GQN2_9ASTR